jgi:hypothetical protein
LPEWRALRIDSGYGLRLAAGEVSECQVLQRRRAIFRSSFTKIGLDRLLTGEKQAKIHAQDRQRRTCPEGLPGPTGDGEPKTFINSKTKITLRPFGFLTLNYDHRRSGQLRKLYT